MMGTSLPEPRETRLRRLKMRSMRRGMREMDLILTAFAASELDGMSDAELDRYDQLLEEYDPDLYRWIAGQQPPPEEHRALVERIARGASGVTGRL
ncbi:succinate dehydrogenase assembly factor 2 [Pseudoroseicyclus aestuarii]|uniref:FAD assembly factor SdhE n=1 Tax=Pseudoroseicyclus aestuarii TaxID=1795041 RepID=A0A318SQG8_9RHOB|nr:succinate dehydrogenase assembly factor 2 [Pseudoroseicyclus aestuarii]PYE83923.1 antitoxin CptB [Pseudoroseicyclus aestuarii]